MTHKERLAEVETRLLGWADDCEADDQDSIDLEYLLTRVRVLTEALEKIAEDFGTDHCDGNCMIAHDALSD